VWDGIFRAHVPPSRRPASRVDPGGAGLSSHSKVMERKMAPVARDNRGEGWSHGQSVAGRRASGRFGAVGLLTAPWTVPGLLSRRLAAVLQRFSPETFANPRGRSTWNVLPDRGRASPQVTTWRAVAKFPRARSHTTCDAQSGLLRGPARGTWSPCDLLAPDNRRQGAALHKASVPEAPRAPKRSRCASPQVAATEQLVPENPVRSFFLGRPPNGPRRPAFNSTYL
jgi:hypothetical protein